MTIAVPPGLAAGTVQNYRDTAERARRRSTPQEMVLG